MDATQAVAQLSEDKAECDREHQGKKMEAMQNELRLSTERHAQNMRFRLLEWMPLVIE